MTRLANFQPARTGVLVVLVLCALACAQQAQAALITFDGENDSDWQDANNWDGDTLPTLADDVVIPDGFLVELSSGNALANSVVIGTGASGSLQISGGAVLTLAGDDQEGSVNGMNSGLMRVEAGASFTLSDGQVSDLSFLSLLGGVTTISAGQSLSVGAVGVTANDTVILANGSSLMVNDADGFEFPDGSSLSAAAASIEITVQSGTIDLSIPTAVGSLTLNPDGGGIDVLSDLSFNTAFNVGSSGNTIDLGIANITGAQDADANVQSELSGNGSTITFGGNVTFDGNADVQGTDVELMLDNTGAQKALTLDTSVSNSGWSLTLRGVWSISGSSSVYADSLTFASTAALATSCTVSAGTIGGDNVFVSADTTNCTVVFDSSVGAGAGVTFSGTNGGQASVTINDELGANGPIAVNAGSMLTLNGLLYTEDSLSAGATGGGSAGGIIVLADGSEIDLADGASFESFAGSTVRTTTGSRTGAPTVLADSHLQAISVSLGGNVDINGLIVEQESGSAGHTTCTITQTAQVAAFNYVRWTWNSPPSAASHLQLEAELSVATGSTFIGHSFGVTTGSIVIADAGAVTELSVAFRDYLYDGVNAQPATSDPSLAAANSQELNGAGIIWYGTATWQGNVSADWTDGDNWDIGRAPGVGDDAIVSAPMAGGSQPTLPEGSTIFVNDLEVQSGVTLTINGSFHVTGSAAFDGETPAGTGTLIFDGGESASITSGFADPVDFSITVAKSNNATLTIAATLATNADFSVGSGIADISNGMLRIAGNLSVNGELANTGTGVVEFFGNGSSTISGNGTLEMGQLNVRQAGSTGELILARNAQASMGATLAGGDVRLAGYMLTLGGSTVTIAARIDYADGVLDLQADTVDLESTDQIVTSGSGTSANYQRGGILFGAPVQGRIRFSGAGSVALSIDSLSWLTNLHVAFDNPSDTLTISGSTPLLRGNVIVEQGIFNLGNTDWTLYGNLVSNAVVLGDGSLVQSAGGSVNLVEDTQRVMAASGRAGFDGSLYALNVNADTWLGISTDLAVADLVSVRSNSTLELLGGASLTIGNAMTSTAGTFIVEPNALWLSNGNPTPSLQGAGPNTRFACIVQGEAHLNGLNIGYYDASGLRIVDNAFASAINSVSFSDAASGGVHITFRAYHSVTLGDPEFVNNTFDGTATRASVLADGANTSVSLRFASDNHGVATKEELSGALVDFTLPGTTTLFLSTPNNTEEYLRLPGQDGVIVGSIGVRAAGNPALLESLQLNSAVTGAGATTLGDIADAVWLVPDWNHNGQWDEGEDAFGGDGSLAPGSVSATFTGTPILGIPVGPQTLRLLVVVDFSANDVVDNSLRFNLLSSTSITTTQPMNIASSLPIQTSNSRAVASAFNIAAGPAHVESYSADIAQSNIPSLQVALNGELGITSLSGITIDLFLNNNDAAANLGPIHVYVDANGNGIVDGAETEIVTGGTPIHQSQRTLINFPSAVNVAEGETVYLLVTLDSADTNNLININYQMRLPVNFNDTLYSGELTNAGDELFGSRVIFPTTSKPSSGCAVALGGSQGMAWLAILLALLSATALMRRRA